MKILTASVAALAAATLFASTAGSLAACDFHKQQVNAQATPAPTEETTTATSTPVDPTLVAEAAKPATTEEKPPEVK